jgi:deoxyribodipyrimidine photo-lyase
MRHLVWFRTDLRTTDHTALFRAAEQATRGVVGVYLISPGEWRAHDEAPVKIEFILRTLRVLSADLAKLNIPLVIATAASPADIPATLMSLASEHGCEALHFHHQYELNESRTGAAVTRAFEADGRAVFAYHDQVYAPPGDIRTGQGTWYTVFSPFKRALYAHLLKQGLPEPLGLPKAQPAMPCRASQIPERVEGFASTIDPSLWPAGEHAAKKQLAAFICERGSAYKDQRDFPARPGTSVLSPHLNIGTISCRQCLSAAVAANPVGGSRSPLDSGDPGIVHWISELGWREFYLHILKGFPRVCMHRAFQPATEQIRWSDNDDHFHAWCQGKTGVPIVDAGIRQMLTTGWMHNRVRMIVAMYLTKNLFIDWRRGETFFMRHLIDGFLASNNGGWQWSASTGTDAAPYFRIFNPVSQSQKFDPAGDYIRRFVPSLHNLDSDSIHEPWEIPSLLRGKLDYPEPLVDLSASREAAIEAFRSIK